MTLARLQSRVATIGCIRALIAIGLMLSAIRLTLEFVPFTAFLAGIFGLSSVLLLAWATVDATRAERAYRIANGGLNVEI